MGERDELERDVGAVSERLAEYLFHGMLEQASEMGLTLAQVQALSLLGVGSRSSGEMAAALRVSAPAITQLTDRLIRTGLIERRAEEGDRRVVNIALTAQGLEMVADLRGRLGSIVQRSVLLLEESEREAAMTALSGMARALEQHTAAKTRPTSGRRRGIVEGRRGGSPRNAIDEARTAPAAPAASNDLVQWKAGNTSRKVKIEWD